MNRRMVISIIAAISLIALIAIAVALNSTQTSYAAKYAGADLSDDVGEVVRQGTYSKYIAAHKDAANARIGVDVDILHPTIAEQAEIGVAYNGKENCIVTGEESRVAWNIMVPESGFYFIVFEYCPVESRGINAERTLEINGAVPFRGADCLTFTRFWEAANEVKTDNRGNEIRPMQQEVYRWDIHYAADDYNGYLQEPYRFYFEKGENSIALVGVTEPVAFSSIRLMPITEENTYSDYLTKNADKPNRTDNMVWCDVVQGEAAVLKSDSSLYATYDRSAPNTVPYSVSLTKLNMIGGTSWSIPGQWIEWSITVPEDGLYNFAVKGRQNYSRGQNAVREFLIDGEEPFSDGNLISFTYSNDWEVKPLGDENGAYSFYLTAGEHRLRLRVVLDEMGDVLMDMEDSLSRLNLLYRQLLMLMGKSPDRYRDYNIDGYYPDMAKAMGLESKRLYKIVDDINRISGGKSSNSGSILTLARLTEEFSEDTSVIKKRLGTYRDNLSSMGTVIQSLAQSQLDIDYLVVKTGRAEWPDDKATFISKTGHEIRSFFASFTTDYTSLGNVHGDEAIDVWILTGRDQANILKTIIDDDFTPRTGIAVNLKLVEGGTVLPAVVAGTGPDLILSSGQGEPVNYAMRGAVEDLKQFDDCDEVLSRFTESAIIPFRYGDGVVALPETQGFSVLFYRTDILEELGLSVPETWDDLSNMIPVLQEANMDIGLPDILNRAGADLSGFYAMMYQNGCKLYSEDGKRALLDDEGTIQAFEFYSKFYTNHEQPSEYNFMNRFRSGEMPIGISGFTTANALSVFAPELKGLWGFALLPGTVKEDGTIDHTAYSGGSSCMILRSDDTERKAQCWEFLKWWTSTDTQARFGKEMECIMGASARYATANVEAFERLPWSAAEMRIIEEQRRWTQSNQEVPGGYYTGRHLMNAIRKVVNERELPRETLLDYNQSINEEITKKRAEFGLD